ncbi:hypothetical protein SEMRO_754_G197540.1 [Seminavis robusta]|uniref:DUF6824 domain-containing protein n=1 Tax=Seminavis robusta TaxID=568900 RepID=A0A9N8HML2_9STRA|nr:hypothetical protein SEMRO_754_G197540.1 [Seminavis robusta]|eukprot:Sro754_g197540.1 n/a (321) ;mRNA; r:44349-45405
MMFNPDDESPHQEHNRALPNNESLDRKISVVPDRVSLRPNDVLCGRSKESFNHAGNRRFRNLVAASLAEYNEATSKWAKSMVAARLVGVINNEGGRFLKQRKGNEEVWYEISTQDAKAKVSHAIRDAIAAKEKFKGSKSDSSVASNVANSKSKEEPNKKMAQDQAHSRPPGMLPHSEPSSLSSIAGPIISMPGFQPHMGVIGASGPNRSVVQDQIQNLRHQHIRAPNITPPLFGTAGASLTSHPGMPPLGMGSQHQGHPFPHGHLLGTTGPVVPPHRASRPPQEAKNSSSSSDGDGDGDNDFLSLIDSVLGPMPPGDGKG